MTRKSKPLSGVQLAVLVRLGAGHALKIDHSGGAVRDGVHVAVYSFRGDYELRMIADCPGLDTLGALQARGLILFHLDRVVLSGDGEDYLHERRLIFR